MLYVFDTDQELVNNILTHSKQSLFILFFIKHIGHQFKLAIIILTTKYRNYFMMIHNCLYTKVLLTLMVQKFTKK